MNAIVVHEFGPPSVLKLEPRPDPTPSAGQVVVRIHGAGVNPVDTYIRSGSYSTVPNLPYTPGSDAAGVVESVGAGVTSVRAGERVYVARSVTGTYAEKALCDASQVRRLPDRVSFAQGAAVFVPYATAYRALFQRAKAAPGEWVLVHGASGGVGIAAVQFGAAAGLRVIGTAGTERGRALVLEHGALHALDHAAPGYLDQVRAITGYPAGGVHVVVEMLANINLESDLGLLAMGGRVVVVGSRGAIQVTPRQTMARDSMILGMALFNASVGEMEQMHAAIGAGLGRGTLTPVVRLELPLKDAPRAHELVMESGAYGKIVLAP